MLLGVAFTVLLLLISGVSAILSPENVTLSCRNLNVSVSWEYGQQNPGTSFRVRVGGTAWDLVNDTTEHRYDLSRFVWASEEDYLDYHYVTVTAKEGGNQSESVTSTFTFNPLKTAGTYCKLEFPPVDVIESESGATVSFKNPLLFYGELKRAPKSHSATFKFTVSSVNSEFGGACTASDDICKLDISFPEGAEKCVTALKGWLYEGSGVRYVEFRETGPVCPSTSTEVHVLMLTILLFVFGIIASVLIIVICKLKAWTMKVPPQPSPLLPDHKDPLLVVQRYAPVSRTDISPVTLADNRLCKNPSLSSGEEDDLQTDSGVDNQRQLLARQYAEGGLSEGYGRDEDSADDSEKTEIVSMDVEEEVVEASGYDRPQTLQVDMGEGDMVTGYSER